MTVSFDVWGTLIQASPEFSKAKVSLVKKIVGNIASETEIIDSFRKIKKYHDGLVEEYGNQPDNYTLFCELFSDIGVTGVDIEQFIKDYFALFLKYPPILIPGTKLVLDSMKSRDHDLVISSNTLFINGETLASALDILGIKDYFGELRFSDQEGCSKPSMDMFNISADFHVGDNKNTDGACIIHGINFYQINSNKKTIIDFYEEIILSSSNK